MSRRCSKAETEADGELAAVGARRPILVRQRQAKRAALGDIDRNSAECAERLRDDTLADVGSIGEAGEQTGSGARKDVASEKPAAMVAPALVEDVDPALGEPCVAAGEILLDAGRQGLDVSSPVAGLARVQRQDGGI